MSVSKSGYTQVVPGQSIRYTFKEIGNNSTVPLDNFFWRDTLPTDAVRLDKIILIIDLKNRALQRSTGREAIDGVVIRRLFPDLNLKGDW